MPRPTAPPRIVKWRGTWYLFYTDPFTGKPKRERCAAHGATNAKERKALVARMVADVAARKAETWRRGGLLRYDAPLANELLDYLTDVEERADARLKNPEARDGTLAQRTARELRDDANRFLAWLDSHAPGLKTGEVSAEHLARYFRHLAAEPTRRGKSKTTVHRAPATLAKQRRSVRAAFGWINRRRPPRFPDFAHLVEAFRGSTPQRELGEALTPDALTRFLGAALEYEDPNRTVIVSRRREVVVTPYTAVAGKSERFEQRAPSHAATPVSRLFLLLALTGCRRGEALALRWDDVDLDRGRLTIRAQKTGRRRVLPLIGAPEGDLAPEFTQLLRRWRLEAGEREYVLPHTGLGAPKFTDYAWKSIRTLAKVERVGPQELRRSFVSYCASLGVPAAVAALWTGHDQRVAERWYRQQVLERNSGPTLEAAMGLEPMIHRLTDPAGDEALHLHVV